MPSLAFHTFTLLLNLVYLSLPSDLEIYTADQSPHSWRNVSGETAQWKVVTQECCLCLIV